VTTKISPWYPVPVPNPDVPIVRADHRTGKHGEDLFARPTSHVRDTRLVALQQPLDRRVHGSKICHVNTGDLVPPRPPTSR
jgi:hypothetical protein